MNLVAATMIICQGLSAHCAMPVMEKHGFVSKNACSYKPITARTTDGTHTISIRCGR
jgi:hypothetical protein